MFAVSRRLLYSDTSLYYYRIASPFPITNATGLGAAVGSIDFDMTNHTWASMQSRVHLAHVGNFTVHRNMETSAEHSGTIEG